MRTPHYEEGEYHFDDRPDFITNYSPQEMISMGVFGGNYFNREEYREMIHPEVFEVDDCKYNLEVQDKKVNHFKMLAGNDRKWWEDRNLINHMYNTEGWFQWYCRFYYGRRCDDDDREIGRFINFRLRHLNMYYDCLERYKSGGVKKALMDDSVYPKYKQSIFQWAINPKMYYDEFRGV